MKNHILQLTVIRKVGTRFVQELLKLELKSEFCLPYVLGHKTLVFGPFLFIFSGFSNPTMFFRFFKKSYVDFDLLGVF